MQGLTYLLGSLAGVITALIAAYIAWRKLPYERTSLTVRSADEVNEMTLRFARAAGDEASSLQVQLDTLRTIFENYRTSTEVRLSELADELREERAEKRHVKEENERLRERVKALETEVAQLKSDRQA